MEQYLLPLPPILQEMDFENNRHQNEEEEQDYYYEEGDLFQWPSRFCADPLWIDASQQSAGNSLPTLSVCFQHSILAQLAPLFLLLSLPILLINLSNAKKEQNGKCVPLPFGMLEWSRYVITIVLFSLKLLLWLIHCYEWIWLGKNVPLIELIYPVTQMAALTLLLHYTEQSRIHHLVIPGTIFCTWLVFVLSGLLEFIYTIEGGINSKNNHFIWQLIQLAWWPLCALQLFLHFFAGSIPPTPNEQPNYSPESHVSFLNRQFFFWLDPLIRLGYRQPINEFDLYRLVSAYQAKRLFKKWSREWNRQLEKHFSVNNSKLPRISFSKWKMGKKDEEKTPLMKNNNSSSSAAPGQFYGSSKIAARQPIVDVSSASMPSIIFCLWHLFKWDISGAMLAKFLSDLLQFSSPLLLGQMITFTEDLRIPNWWGFMLAVALFLSSELRSLLMNAYFLLMNNVGCKVQSVLTSAVYAKTLKLSSAARRERTSGEIVNLMAIDVDRFQTVIPLLQQIWSSPLQIIISLFLLYQIIGWAVIGGVFIMLALIPCNFSVMRFTKRWQAEQMSCKDKRLRLINEVLTGIRAVKLYAWEVPMMRAIEDVRRQEMQLIRRASLLRTCSDVLNICSPFIVAIVTFAIFIYSDPANHVLTPQIAFVSLLLFSQLRIPMIVLAELIGQLIQTIVSNRRLKQFLIAEEIDPDAVQRDPNPEYDRSIDVEFASFDWIPIGNSLIKKKHSYLPIGHSHSAKHGLPFCIPYTLNDVELHIRRGLIVAIVGKVGSGKSSLLNAILGEMGKAYGYIGVRGQIAYVPQQPWILNRTVRENILFAVDDNEAPNEELYSKVVEACALKADFAVLPDGDETEIGERGINLSGGQKARVNLARALYRQADVYLLDDPLSAVDAIVGRHLFERAIGPDSDLVKGSTRILVTHSLAYLAKCDWIVVLKDGQIKRQGTYEELLQENDVAQLIAKLEEEEENPKVENNEEEIKEEKEEEEVEEDSNGTISDVEAELTLKSAISGEIGSAQVRKRLTRSSRGSSKQTATQKTLQIGKKAMAITTRKLVQEEGAKTGQVNPKIYLEYFAAMGWPLFFCFIIFSCVQSALTVSQSFWLSSWSDDNSLLASSNSKTSLTVRFAIYAIQGIGIIVFLGLANTIQILGSVSASIRLHYPLLESVLHAPVSFFDTTPLGRILNRFGKEFDTLDSRLIGAVRMTLSSFLSVAQVFLQISISMPLFILLILPVSIIYLFIMRYFIPTSRQLQRLTSITRSPLYNYFAETINGISSIRAYGMAQGFFDNFCSKLDTHIGCRYFSLISNRWLSIRLELIGSIVILFCSILAVFSRDWGTATAGLIGLAVSKSLDITFILSFLVRSLNDVELSIVSVERVLEYKDCPQEAAWHTQKGKEMQLANWPSQGAISFQNYSCRYRPELGLSLRSINAEIRPKEKVGVVGRTGAGKTSMALSLFRIIEAAEGRILIDGVDIAEIGLQELRSAITIIPQDPVLFSGTLRFNLDPFGIYTDSQLWTVLEHVHLKGFVESKNERLSHEIAESGENISVGQRQLLCLARAILRRSPLIVLDEATASIDSQTDTLVQRTIRNEFKESTILTIAHRISTVIDYDRIMVMVDGRLVEFDTPHNLMANNQSYFHGLVNTSMEEDGNQK